MKNHFKTVLVALLGVFCVIGTTPLWAAAHEREKKDNVDYEQLKIKSYKHWDLYLHENQCYSIDGEVCDEFFSIGQSMKTALKTLFQPDKMNYAALSNTSPVIHVHIVPRYKESREFAGDFFKTQDGDQTMPPMINLMSPMNWSFFKFGMPYETNYNREAAASKIGDCSWI